MYKIKRWLVWAAIAAVSLVVIVSWASPVQALTLTNRFIEVSTAQPSANATHTFQFFLPSTTTLGSIVFLYCENSPLIDETCTPPPGLDVLSASLNGQTGNTGFSFDGASSTANKLVIARTPAAASVITSNYNFGGIVNPSTAGSTEFVRITTYASADGSGSFTDNGTVAFATVSPFSVGANVPPFLQICVAITVASDCSTTSGDRINLGTLSSNSVKAGTTQFAVGTNSISGYTVFAEGTTMTSGNNAITALSSPTPSFPGNNQFGINLRDNSIPNVGSDPFGSGSGTPTAGYNTVNQFKYVSGDSIAQSTLPSDYNRMTASYIVNINSSQAPGVYASTFTYTATATF